MPSREVDTELATEEVAQTNRSPTFVSRPDNHLNSWRVTLTLAFTGLGVIYGDIGTSPLYVFNAIFPADGPVPSKDDVIGACSAILWSIMIVPVIKYSLIAIEFGFESTQRGGREGGPFAVYTALYPPVEEADGTHALTTYTTASANSIQRSRLSPFFGRLLVKNTLFAWVLFGTCLTISDGLLTPAVSIVSAVEGLAIGVPSVGSSDDRIIGISVAILVALFTLQPLGVHRVGMLFAPIVAIWLVTIGVSGIINITNCPGVFRAFDPSRAVMLFVRTKDFSLMAGVLLAITGVEALFANLGSFSKLSIRLGFDAIVFPSLIFAYLGQSARLITDGENAIQNVFFQSIPGPTSGHLWWFTWTLAILATIVASQAMISATFSLVQQMIRLSAMPPFKVVNTSDNHEGQVFAPMVNFLLMVGTIGVTAGFGTDSGLTTAYGFAVSGVLVVTTTILTIAMVQLKGLPTIVAIAFFLFFTFIDSLFFGSSLTKVPHGAWFSLSMAVLLCIIFLFWSWVKKLEINFDRTHRHRLGEILQRTTTHSQAGGDDEVLELSDKRDTQIAFQDQISTLPKQSSVQLKLLDGQELPRIPILALFHNHSALNGAPHGFACFLRSYPALPDITVFFNIHVVGSPHTIEAERYTVSRVRSFEDVYVATLRLGYRDPVDLEGVATPICDRILALEARQATQEGRDSEVIHKFEKLNRAKESITHVLTDLQVYSSSSNHNYFVRVIRRFLIDTVYRRIRVNFDENDGMRFGGTEEIIRIAVRAAV